MHLVRVNLVKQSQTDNKQVILHSNWIQWHRFMFSQNIINFFFCFSYDSFYVVFVRLMFDNLSHNIMIFSLNFAYTSVSFQCGQNNNMFLLCTLKNVFKRYNQHTFFIFIALKLKWITNHSPFTNNSKLVRVCIDLQT